MIHRIFKTFNLQDFSEIIFICFWSCTTKSVRKITRSSKNWIFYMYYRLILHLKLHLFIWSLVSIWSMCIYQNEEDVSFGKNYAAIGEFGPKKVATSWKTTFLNDVTYWILFPSHQRSRNLGNLELEKLEESSRKNFYEQIRGYSSIWNG